MDYIRLVSHLFPSTDRSHHVALIYFVFISSWFSRYENCDMLIITNFVKFSEILRKLVLYNCLDLA